MHDMRHIKAKAPAIEAKHLVAEKEHVNPSNYFDFYGKVLIGIPNRAISTARLLSSPRPRFLSKASRDSSCHLCGGSAIASLRCRDQASFATISHDIS
ncbi:hypothetical protein F2Q69_00029738 [Brassica cretica]|uniref:Uncharacterized protein n=1 Tax=Brassica cretica TaxID=69181 RepID=A0A8S9S9V1_BRACR|nr:hypothetical protein F2Q69_00029738 [Brassica cretica]